jgi:hypothetical protein
MTLEASARTYSGLARFLDRNGLLIDVGRAEVAVTDPEIGAWGGTIAVFKGSSLEMKLLTGLVETSGGRRALATVGPKQADLANDLIAVKVVGIEPPPF